MRGSLVSVLTLRPRPDVQAQAVAEPAAKWRRFELLIAVGVGSVAALVSWLRLPPQSMDTIWAEDGPVFLRPLVNGLGWQVFQPYAGYLHVLAHLVTGVSYQFAGIASVANAVIVGCCVSYGVIAGLVFYFARDVLRHLETRVMVALIVALAPVAGLEALHNVANLHWFLLYLAPWLLLARPRSTLGTVLKSVLALAITLTEVQAFIFAPLVLWLWRRRPSWPVFIAFGCGIIVQFVVYLSFPRGAVPVDGPPWKSTVAGYLLNNGVSFWSVDRMEMTDLVVRFRWPGAFAVTVPLLAAFVIAFWRGRGDGRIRTATVTFLVASVAAWVLPYVLNHSPGTYYTENVYGPEAPFSLVRWATTSSMFLIVGIPLMVDVLGRRSRPLRIGGAAVLLIAVAVMSLSFAAGNRDRAGTPWHVSVTTAAQQCRTSGDADVAIPIQPGWADWKLIVPCPLVAGS